MSIIGTRLRIDYADQNESFAPHLPRTGTVEAEVTVEGQARKWFLFALDEPFEFQFGHSPLAPQILLNVSEFLVQSRWVGHEIGEAEPASVFIMLVREPLPPNASVVDTSFLLPIAWGTSYTEPRKA
jgi:hypothetical protein